VYLIYVPISNRQPIQGKLLKIKRCMLVLRTEARRLGDLKGGAYLAAKNLIDLGVSRFVN
jgi:hypothetical protein